MTVNATKVQGQKHCLPNPFGIIFALKAPLFESHCSFMQIQYKRFIACLGAVLFAIVITIRDLQTAFLAF